MTTLGTLSGRGHLFAGDVELGEVEYEIDVLVERGLKHGEGRLRGEAGALFKAMTARENTLRLGGSREVKIVIKQLTGADAVILTSGAIPGY